MRAAAASRRKVDRLHGPARSRHAEFSQAEVRKLRPLQAFEITERTPLPFATAVGSQRKMESSRLDAGARVRGVRGLHAKLFLFGGSTAIGTSANVTDAGMMRNHEFGFVTDDPEVVSECGNYFDRLWKRSGNDLTSKQVREWQEIVDQARKTGSGKRPNSNDQGRGALGRGGRSSEAARRQCTEAVAEREGPDIAAVDDDLGPVAVIFQLVNPALPVGRLAGEGG